MKKKSYYLIKSHIFIIDQYRIDKKIQILEYISLLGSSNCYINGYVL